MNRLTNPSEERIYRLKSFQIPPKGYEEFLEGALVDFESLLLDENRCSTLDELGEINWCRIIGLNPDKKSEKTIRDNSLHVILYGAINYSIF